VFLILFFGLFSWVFFVASKNAADSGESGMLLKMIPPRISMQGDVVNEDWTKHPLGGSWGTHR